MQTYTDRLKRPGELPIPIFIKREGYFKDKPPRIIAPHMDIFNCRIWEDIQIASDVVYSQKFSVKGLTTYERMDKIIETFPDYGLFLSTDISRMEASYNEVIFKLENYMMKKLVPQRSALWDELYEAFT